METKETQSSGSLSGLGSEILIADWQARAEQCEQTAEQFRAMTTGIVSSYQEKAHAYRKCIEDLRRQMELESKRSANAELTDGQ